MYLTECCLYKIAELIVIGACVIAFFAFTAFMAWVRHKNKRLLN